MNFRFAPLLALVALGAASATAVPARADDSHLHAAWDHDDGDRYDGARHDDRDRRDALAGTVTGFEPYRLQIARRDGNVQTIDLKNGTVILPRGATPSVNERVIVFGYYSRGTFVANRILIRV